MSEDKEFWFMVGPAKPFKGGYTQPCVMVKAEDTGEGVVRLSLEEAQGLVNQLEHILETSKGDWT